MTGDGPFDYARFYKELRESERLQVSRDEMTWVQRYRAPERPADVLVGFSCGMQSVPHLMLVLTALLEQLGVDFVGTAGPEFCCGKPYQRSVKRREMGDRVAATTIRRNASYRPSVSVQCCGSCFVEFTRQVGALRDRTGSAPYEVVHITRFILDTLKRLGDAVPWRREIPCRVLLHAEGAEVHPSKVVHRDDVIETLGLIPGVEYAGLVADPARGSPCVSRQGEEASVLSDLSADEYEEVLAELRAQADAADAQMILTLHHKCHREWSKFTSRRLPVVYYPALLCEALGVAVRDRFQMLWRLGDPEQVLAHTRGNWESWGISEEEARELVRKFFVPEYADGIQRCPCEGTCFTAPAGAGDDTLCTAAGLWG
ncbi:MAG TPA: heterodisulfide reductase-related iron-sulfur binding cluster [Streptosporangiaceae bacterium]|nr:heterodisulfide reductase-related iron-sulfur binding cluster [Streptosporangiaceae bacterium]